MTVVAGPDTLITTEPSRLAVVTDRARDAVPILLALVAFGVLVALRGANPFDVYRAIIEKSFTDWDAMGETLVKACPFVFAALAVTIPARAGLTNIGGEGQIVIGAVASAGIALVLEGNVPGWGVQISMLVAALVAGGIWAGAAAGLRLGAGVNEAISTLLMNYLAITLMLFLIFDRWKDAAGFGQPASRPLRDGSELPTLGDSRLHLGVLVALIATVIVAVFLARSAWGFRLRVVGGNLEAARRAGLPVKRLVVSAMVVGGALGAAGGWAHFAGVEGQLRPGITTGYGYIGFLAAWLGRQRPVAASVAAVLLGAIAIGGDSLQLDAGLPAATVNILMGLLLLAVLGTRRRPRSV